MESLALAAITFTGLHLLVSGTRLRDALVARLGERPYQGLFSLASAAALTWLIWAYGKVRVPQLTPLASLKGLADVLVLVAFALMVLGLMTPGPTAVGAEKLLDQEPRGIHRITRHPFLWGIALWAAVHMLFNAEPPGLWFFGAFMVTGVAGTFSIDAKRARRFGARWSGYAAKTSNVPFAAIAQGRSRFALGEIGAMKLGVALAVFAVFAALHARFFGLAPF